jgi:hypothetical protein
MAKKDFWGLWKKKQKTFTSEQVKELLEHVKVFNSLRRDQSDPYLTKHVDKVFEEWAKKNG